jgi:hypothetical protein
MTTHEQDMALYLEQVRGAATLSEWWSLFSNLCATLPSAPSHALPRPSAMSEVPGCYSCGNLVVEYRRDMHGRWGDPNASLRLGLSRSHARHPDAPLAALATNGLSFHIYKPDFDENGHVIEMRPVDGLNLASPMMTPQRAMDEISGLLQRWL